MGKNIPDYYILNKNQNIKTIYHIADIHIRKYERHEEYNNIFNKLYQKIKKDNKNSLIVCCGDIIHEGISGECIILIKNFFINLCKICDVIVFKGNHDLTHRNNEKSGFLIPILTKLKTKNKLHILNQRGLYEYGNLLFGYTTMTDETIVSPSHDCFKNKIKIALYHGTLHGCSLNEYKFLFNNSKFNQTNFSEYDYAMLGDLHKFTYLNKKKTIAYPGSLIQQNHGETIENHGFIKWDLEKKKSKFKHIENDYGFLTITIENNKILKYDINKLPQNINLKIIQKNSSDILVEKLKERLCKKINIKQCHVEKIEFGYDLKNIVLLNKKKNNSIGIIKNNDMALNLLNKYIDKNYNYSKKEKMEINKILIDIMKNMNYEYNSMEKNIKLKKIWFDNFNVYGEGNYIDYELLNGIINISGPNGIGKSSLIIVILYAIYGNYDNISKHDYINIKKKNMNTKIIFEINEIEYTIEREEKVKGKNKIGYKSDVRLYKGKKDISKKSIIEIEKQIISLVGDSDKLINLCIMTQKNCNSFIDLSDNEKKKFLCDILKLDIYNNIGKELLNKIRIFNMKLKDKYKTIYTDHKNKLGDKEKELNENIKKMDNELKKETKQLIIHEKEYNILNHKKIKTELKIKKYKNINILDISNYNNSLKQLINEKEKKEFYVEKLEQIIKKLNNEKKENNNKIKKYNNIEEKNKKFINYKRNKIEKFEDELKNLYVKLGNNGKTGYNGKNIKIKENEIIKLKNKLKNINSDIEKKEKNIEINEKKIMNYIFSKNLEKKYNEFMKTKQSLEEINKKLDDLIDKLKKNEEYLDIVKNHKYNPKCKECMSNKITNKKITAEENIKILKKEREIINKEKKQIEDKYLALKYYDDEMIKKQKLEDDNNKINIMIENNKKEIKKLQCDTNAIVCDINYIEKNINICYKNKIINRKIEKKNELLKKIKEETNDDYIKYQKLNDTNNNLEREINKKKIILENEKIGKNKIEEKINDVNLKIEKEEKNKEKVKKYNKLIHKKTQLKKEYELMYNNIMKIKEKKRNIEENLIKIKYELKNIIILKKEIKELENRFNIYNKIAVIINGGFVDKLLTEFVIPKFMSLINSILESFVPFKIKMIHENNKKIVIYKDDMTNILKLSGYQQLMVNIAFRLAINQFNKRLKTNFFIMDESFSFCDDVGIYKISNLFDYMKKIYDWIIIISHNEQIKTYTDIDICIEKKGEFSYIKNKIIVAS